MSILKKLASDTALYGVSTMVGRFINYLLVPIQTYFFGPGQLAPQSELYVYAGMAFVIYVMGMETGFFRFGAKSEADKKLYYNVALSAVMVSSCVLSGLAIVFATPLSAAMNFDGESVLYVWMAIILATDAIVSIPFARLRLEKKAVQFVTARMANIFINIALTLFFLVFCRMINEGRFFVFLKPAIDTFYDPTSAVRYIVLANLLANLCFFWFLRKQFTDFRFNFDRKVIRELWLYSYPILIMNLAAVTNMMADRAMFRYLLPDGFYPHHSTRDAFGIYAQCYKLSIFMNLVIQAFKYAAEPFFFSQAENKNAPATFANIMHWFIITCVVLWVGVSLNLDILAHTFLQQKIYHEGIVVVPILLLAFLFLGIYYNLTAWFKLADKTSYGTYITLIGAFSTVVLNIILVPRLGYVGSAITFAFSSFLMMSICYYFGQKYYPVPYQVRSAVVYVISAGVLIYFSYHIKISNLWVSIPYHLALCLLYSLLILVIENQILPRSLRRKLGILSSR
jgi:O-antigen/teichoic acid export membrane protein